MLTQDQKFPLGNVQEASAAAATSKSCQYAGPEQRNNGNNMTKIENEFGVDRGVHWRWIAQNVGYYFLECDGFCLNISGVVDWATFQGISSVSKMCETCEN